jgi:predicted anti-sigma-YlaC factor YlaD
MRRTWRRRELSCRAVGKLLQTHLDGELEDVSAVLVAAHLDDCHRCGLEAEAYQWLVRALLRLAPPVEPERLVRIRAFADELAATA